MRCVKCGTEFIGWPCPTCERNRLLAEQNRKVEEQNRLFEKQNRETALLRDEQERHNRQVEEQYELEEERRSREEQREQELIEEQRTIKQFESRKEELFEYATERNLIPFYVYKEYLDDYVFSDLHDVGLEPLDFSLGIIGENVDKKIVDKYEKEWNKLIDYLKSEERFLDGNECGRCWKPKFKLVDIKQIANTHDTDYVIMKSDNSSNTIFPVSLISGYGSKSGYKVEIGEFTYLMFLKDDEEAEKVTKILSITTKRFTSTRKTVKKLISDTISEYTKANPKPIENNGEDKEIPFLEKKESNSGIHIIEILPIGDGDPPANIIILIIRFLPALLAFPFAKMFWKNILEFFFDSSNGIIAGAVTVAIAAYLSVISRKVLGVVTGILALVGIPWLYLKFISTDGEWWMILILLVVATAIGILFPWTLGKISDKILKDKNSKVEKKNRKIDIENERLRNEAQKKAVACIVACEEWRKGLINSILKRLNNFFDNQKDVKQITD